jgi:hypothetical protein
VGGEEAQISQPRFLFTFRKPKAIRTSLQYTEMAPAIIDISQAEWETRFPSKLQEQCRAQLISSSLEVDFGGGPV